MNSEIEKIIKQGWEFGRNTTWSEIEETEARITSEDRKIEYRSRWGDQFIGWALLEGSETIQDFCQEFFIDRDTLHRWSKMDANFGRKYKLGKRILGNKTYKGWLHGKLNGSAANLTLSTLDEDYGRMQKEQAALRQPEISEGVHNYIYQGSLKAPEETKKVKE